jgi:hypothetical protein
MTTPHVTTIRYGVSSSKCRSLPRSGKRPWQLERHGGGFNVPVHGRVRGRRTGESDEEKAAEDYRPVGRPTLSERYLRSVTLVKASDRICDGRDVVVGHTKGRLKIEVPADDLNSSVRPTNKEISLP